MRALMHWTLLALAASGALLQAEPKFVNGQAARLVVGQVHFTRQNPTPARNVSGAASGLAVGGNRLFVAEGSKIGASPRAHRVSVYENLAAIVPDLDADLDQSLECAVCLTEPEIVLGQPDFDTTTPGVEEGLNNPTSVATDGVRLAVADTDNNRVLIWNVIPTENGRQADIVIGQPDFTTVTAGTSQDRLRGPQGVWIDEGRLFVADTQNSRILIWNSVPTSNGAGADIVVGQPDFNTRPAPDLTQSNFEPTASNLLDPIAVTTRNGRMFIADLGFDRVMIYNSIPTSNAPAADVVLGQPDFTTAGFNNDESIALPLRPRARSVEALCESTGELSDALRTDDDGNDIFGPEVTDFREFPGRCERTLSFPRFAYSDGEKLFISDAGNDRVLVYNEIPTENGAAADVVLGQPDFTTLDEGDGAGNLRAPGAIASDGKNIYVADPFSRRVLVFTPAEDMLMADGLVNGAAFKIRASTFMSIEGDPFAGRSFDITFGNRFDPDGIVDRVYTHEIVEDDNAATIRDSLLQQINDDPDSPVVGVPIFGEGTEAELQFIFSGEADLNAVVTLTVEDRSYSAQLLPDDRLPAIIDRLNFEINSAPDPLILADRNRLDETDLTMRVFARNAGPQANGVSVRVEITNSELVGVSRIPTEEEIDMDEDFRPPGERSFEGQLDGGFFPAGARFFARDGGAQGNDLTMDLEIVRPDNEGDGVQGITGLMQNNGGRLFSGGADARELPAGTAAAAFGEGLAETAMAAQPVDDFYPTELGGVEVFVNGIKAPIFNIAPTQINFQMPIESSGLPDSRLGTSASIFVRRRMPDGSVLTSVPRAATISRATPGLYTLPSGREELRRGVVLHGTAGAAGTIAVNVPNQATNDFDGAEAGIELTVTVEDEDFTYTTEQGDTAEIVRDRLVEIINNADSPSVTAEAGQQGFFSARADIQISGEIQAGDVVTFTINGRDYVYTVGENDTIVIVRNRMVNLINAGLGDPEVTARRLFDIGIVRMQVVARSLGIDGNDIPFTVSTSAEALIVVERTDVDADDNVPDNLTGGNTPPVIRLFSRVTGREANFIRYSAQSSSVNIVALTARAPTLCCGNDPLSLVTEENPAIPGEEIIVIGTGLGLAAAPTDTQLPLTGQIVPERTDFAVPLVAEDFVSSLAGGRTATVLGVFLMPGTAGLYQINLRLNELLPDNPDTPLTIAQVLNVSNAIAIPVKNLRPPGNNTVF